MKFLPSFKSAKAIALAAITIATAIASSVAPSQASQPTRIIPATRQHKIAMLGSEDRSIRIIQTAGQPEIVIFGSDNIGVEGQSVASGCQAIRDLWQGVPTQKVSPQEYQDTISSRRGPGHGLAGHLYCNSPKKVKAYTSPVFSYAGIIVTDGVPFYVTTRAFFIALGIAPTQLNKAEGIAFLNQNRQVNSNPTLFPNLAALTSSIRVANKGAYVARYSIRYNAKGLKQDAFDVPVGKKGVFNLPSRASNIVVVGEYYTGFFDRKKEFFRKELSGLDGSICYTTTGNIVNPKVNDGCN